MVAKGLAARLTVYACVLVGAACRAAPTQRVDITATGTVDFELGVDGAGDAARPFIRVSGLTFDSSGEIVVADAGSGRIFVYTAGGRYSRLLAPDSAGSSPCCVTLHRGLVWMLDRNANVYSGYAPGDSGTLARDRFVVTTPASWLSSRIVFDTLGRLIHMSDVGGPSRAEQRELRHFVAHAPAHSSTDTLPLVASAALDRSELLVKNATGSSLFRQPFGPAPLQAFGPNGEYAFAVSSRYEVFVWSADLRTRRVIAKPVPAADLSWSERRSARRTLESIAKARNVAIGDLPFGLPDHRPVLEALMFDLSGRLWVERSDQQGHPHVADVYDAEGQPAGTVAWPAGISLEFGAIRDSVAIGTLVGGFPGQRVVRLTFRRSGVTAMHVSSSDATLHSAPQLLGASAVGKVAEDPMRTPMSTPR